MLEDLSSSVCKIVCQNIVEDIQVNLTFGKDEKCTLSHEVLHTVQRLTTQPVMKISHKFFYH